MKRLRAAVKTALIGSALAFPALVSAAETITYVYDARGRLIRVERSGTVNNGVKTEYQHDKADNRTRVKTIGSLNAPPP